MKKPAIATLLVTLSALSLVEAYHVLVIFTVPSRSHTHLGKGIVRALVNAGHQVTWATSFPDAKPMKNVKQIDVSETQELVKVMDMLDERNREISLVKLFATNISLITLKNEALRKAITEEKYDAIVTEWFFSDFNAGIAAVQQAPWILVSCTSMNAYLESLVDEVRSLSIIPMPMTAFPIPMNFFQRVINTAISSYFFFDEWWNYSNTVSVYEELFSPIAAARGMSLPPFTEALYNISILFLNSHPSFVPAQSLPPNVVEVAGYHIDENISALPKDLQDLLDNSRQGVVYFSMGSVLRSAALPMHIRTQLIKILSELPYTVLWKFEEKLEGLPKNVHIRSWMPQPSILAHPNVKLFITHGGLLSTMEALHFGVPLLALPVFGDQHSNAQKAVGLGYGRRVDYGEDMPPKLKVTLKEMMSNNSYYKRAKHLSMLFRARPTSPSKQVQHYIELAISSQGAPHLRSKALLYTWYQRWMVDQLAALLAILYVIYIIVKMIFTKLIGGKDISKKDKVKKNK